MQKSLRRILGAALLLGLLLGLAACGGEGAATMRLRQTEGEVSVADEQGSSLEPKQNLSLFGGYQLGTAAASYAWIDLDQTKLAKMDQESHVTVEKEDKLLELAVDSGSLFFNVSEPLAEDESLTIRTSTMAVGIRGTSGWVEAKSDGGRQRLEVYILEGTVEVSVTEADGRVSSASVNGGEMARLTMADGGAGSIEVYGFEPSRVPAYVLEEVRQDQELAGKISQGSALDLTEALAQEGDADRPDVQALVGAVYFGDYNFCTMTTSQAAQLADKLEETLAAYRSPGQVISRSALIDGGNGVPMLLLAVGRLESIGDMDYTYFINMETHLWQFVDGQLTEMQSGVSFTPYRDYMLCTDKAGDSMSYYVYQYADGIMPAEPTTQAYMDSSYNQSIDGQAVSMEQLQDWLNRWLPDMNTYIDVSKAPGFDRVKGGQPADGTVAALRAYAGQAGGSEDAGLFELAEPRQITSSSANS